MDGREPLSFELGPRGRRCFFEEIEEGEPTRVIDLFVDAGASIMLSVLGPVPPNNLASEWVDAPLIMEEEVSFSTELYSASQSRRTHFMSSTPGIYAVCVSNDNSRIYAKHLQLDVGPPDALISKPLATLSSVSEEYVTAATMLRSIEMGLRDLQKEQQRDRRRLLLNESSDRRNASDVFYGSLLETFIFVVVSLFQIFFVRRWFSARVPANKRG